MFRNSVIKLCGQVKIPSRYYANYRGPPSNRTRHPLPVFQEKDDGSGQERDKEAEAQDRQAHRQRLLEQLERNNPVKGGGWNDQREGQGQGNDGWGRDQHQQRGQGQGYGGNQRYERGRSGSSYVDRDEGKDWEDGRRSRQGQGPPSRGRMNNDEGDEWQDDRRSRQGQAQGFGNQSRGGAKPKPNDTDYDIEGLEEEEDGPRSRQTQGLRQLISKHERERNSHRDQKAGQSQRVVTQRPDVQIARPGAVDLDYEQLEDLNDVKEEPRSRHAQRRGMARNKPNPRTSEQADEEEDSDEESDEEEEEKKEQMKRQGQGQGQMSEIKTDQPVTSFSGVEPKEVKGLGAQSVRNMLDNASTFGDYERPEFRPPQPTEGGQFLPTPDPFISSPYTRETRIPNKVFHGGDSALEEAELRKVDPKTTSVIFFPGQGTQYVGMCGNVNEMSDDIRFLWTSASEVLGYDLLKLCQEGPIEKLNQTEHCQPAVLVSSLTALEKLRQRNPLAVESCVATAGFSIGEVTALVFGGVLSFEDAIKLVKVRAEAMQLAADMVPSTMATVLFGADAKLNYGLSVAKAWCTKEFNIEDPVCSVANYLFPHCKVIGGNLEAIEFLESSYKDFALSKVKRLPVSGAFHTALMRPAAQPVKLCLESLTINPARIPVYSNSTGHRYHTTYELLKVLPKQIYKPVMWEQILHNLFKRPKESDYPTTYECGPGTSLTTVLKLVNAKARASAESISP